MQGGGSDTPLNYTGRRQAARLAARLKAADIRAVYSSPLQRSAYTAQLIARRHGLEVQYVDGLKEINLGNLEGFPSARLIKRFDRYIARNEHITGNDSAGVEVIEAVQQRAWQTVNGLASECRGSNVIVVTHYFVIVTLVCRVLGLELENIGRLRSSPGTMTVFTLEKDSGAHLEQFNSI